MTLILDTSVLFAALDRSDARHRQCRELVDGCDERLAIPAPVLPEIDYLLQARIGPGATRLLLEDITAGVYEVVDPLAEEYARISELIERYDDLPIGFVDAAVLAVTERLAEPKLATLDHRHFSVMRPRHVDSLELVP